jgi:pilus assembly protein CpaB
MHLNRRFAIVVVSSLVWALLVAGIFYRVAASGTHHAGATVGKPLVIAEQALPIGATIGPESVKIIQVPQNLFPKGGFSRAEDVLQRPVVSPIEAEEAIVEARIGAKGSGVGLAPMIPPGLRAISVRVNDVVGVAGFVLPGMRVDVLVTGRPPKSDDMVTNTVLQNIPVLSAGQAIQSDAKGQPISATVVTLLVDPGQAEALTLAISEGHIQLVLRNTTDQHVGRTPGSELRQLYGLAAEPRPVTPPSTPSPGRPPKPAPEPVRPPKTAPVVVPIPAARGDEVLMIRGNQKTIESTPQKAAESK